jgi:phosphoglycerate dehydrogenase-like enzyme
MNYRVGYFLPATEEVYEAIRATLPPGWSLVTLAKGQRPADAAQDLDFLIAGKASRELISAAPRLRFLMTPGLGHEGIDLEAAAERGVPVAITVPGNVVEVAEHTILLMLAVSRRLIELDAALRKGEWLMWNRRLQSFNLAGRMLGLVGLGRIGREVALRAEAFGMRIQYADPFVSDGYSRVTLDHLLATSDIVSLHVPLSGETRGLMNASRLRQMKKGAMLINVSRGELVDEDALVGALESGWLSGAGLDVFATEPPPASHPLFQFPNVVVTPHVASGTADGLQQKAARYVENIQRYLAGQTPHDLIAAAPEWK